MCGNSNISKIMYYNEENTEWQVSSTRTAWIIKHITQNNFEYYQEKLMVKLNKASVIISFSLSHFIKLLYTNNTLNNKNIWY